MFLAPSILSGDRQCDFRRAEYASNEGWDSLACVIDNGMCNDTMTEPLARGLGYTFSAARNSKDRKKWSLSWPLDNSEQVPNLSRGPLLLRRPHEPSGYA